MDPQNSESSSSAVSNAATDNNKFFDALDDNVQVNAVFGKMPFPKFNPRHNIESWFMKVDAWFEFHGVGVRKERQKYTAIIAYGDDEMLNQIYDLVRNPPEVNPYTTIKEAIISRFSESSMARLEKLATGIQLGDGKPSHLLTQLQRTNATSDESVVRRYWIKRLPPAARAVIVGMLDNNPDMSLNQLAITADAVLDSLGGITSISSIDNQINAISPKTSLEKRIDDHDSLLQQINNKLSKLLSGDNARRTRERSQSRSNRSNTPHRSNNSNNQSTSCWYHHRYGTLARKCVKPCDFTSTSNSDSKN